MKRRKLFIFGNSGFAIMVKTYFQMFSEYEVVGFVVDREYLSQDRIEDLPVIPFDECLKKYPPTLYDGFVAIGYTDVNRIREEKIQVLKDMGYKLATYIATSSSVFPSAIIGNNCFIMEQVVIQDKAILNDGVIILPQVFIGHDSIIDNSTFICANSVLNGFCKVGSQCFIGANATVNNGITLADYTVVGAGVHISKNTIKFGIYMSQNAKNVMKNVVENKEDMESAQRLIFNRTIKSS